MAVLKDRTRLIGLLALINTPPLGAYQIEEVSLCGKNDRQSLGRVCHRSVYDPERVPNAAPHTLCPTL